MSDSPIFIDFQDSWVAFARAFISLFPDLLWCFLIAAVLSRLVSSTGFRERFMVCLLLATFGALFGIFMGGSKEGMISTLLPTLITIASGYVAYLQKDDPAEQTRFQNLYVPGTIAMILTVLFSTYFHHYFKS